LEHLDQAIGFYDEGEFLPELAIGLVEKGELLTELRKDSGELERILGRAEKIAESLQMNPVLRRIEMVRGQLAVYEQSPSGNIADLTDRELEVLLLIASGAGNRSIAADLFVSENTVRRHISNIFAKIGVNTRSEATAYVFRNSLITSDEG
jgi:DNA-binding NarL/FixJ family response regulator